MTSKPDLQAMFFSEAIKDKVGEIEFIRALGDMNREEFVGVLQQLLQMWGKQAAHHAFDLISIEPENREAVTTFLKVAHRCAAIDTFLECLVNSDHPIDPAPSRLNHTVDVAYEIVRRNRG